VNYLDIARLEDNGAALIARADERAEISDAIARLKQTQRAGHRQRGRTRRDGIPAVTA
jgi:hypothetical protein